MAGARRPSDMAAVATDLGEAPELASQLQRGSRRALKGYVRERGGAAAAHVGELERRFWAADERLAARAYAATQQSSPLRWAAQVLSLSGDEALWFILPVIAASVLALALGGPQALGCLVMTCELEMLLDLFGAMAVCAATEQVLKCFFQRPRPSCRPYKASLCCMWGEWYSFPSGHTMRGFYLANWLFFAPHARVVLGLAERAPWAPSVALVWAAAVAASRVALGRHHPVDVVVGSVLGSSLSRLVENELAPMDRALLKTACGVSLALQVWFMLLSPLVFRALRAARLSEASARAVSAVLAALYFGFYGAGLFSALLALLAPEDVAVCPAGHLSHTLGANDAEWQCRAWTADFVFRE